MKILQVLGWYHPENFGGAEVYVSALSKRLASQGHDVLITAPAKKLPSGTSSTLRPVTIGYLGRFERVKGVFALAAAIEHLTPSLDCRFDFRAPVVRGDERVVHDELRTRLANDPRVSFQPAVSSSEVAGILAFYDVLRCPSECAEGRPTVAIKAHSVGTPVIVSRIGGLAELVSDRISGRLSEPGDVVARADVLQEVAMSPESTIDVWRSHLHPRARGMMSRATT